MSLSCLVRVAVVVVSLGGWGADVFAAAPRHPGGSEFSAERFLRVFRSGREEPRLKALAEIARFHREDPDVPAALGQAAAEAREKGQLTPSIVQAVQLLGELDQPAAIEPLSKLLADADPRIAVTAADALAVQADEQALDSLIDTARRATSPDQYALRHAAIDAIGHIRAPESVDFLIETLPGTQGQLQYEIARQLTRLTGKAFGDRAADWRQWWDESRATFAFSSDDAPPRSRLLSRADLVTSDAMPWDGPLPAFFSIPIHAYRVVFVIDHSKSMLSSVDNETRLTRVKEELSKAIEALPPETSFEVIAFNQTVTRWKGKLIPATPENKRAALQFIRRQKPRDWTASYDALQAALDTDEFIEAVVFLSDGKPTRGRIVDPPQIVETITAANKFRRIAIHTIAVDSRENEYQFMKDLADRNFGQFQLVR